MALTLREVELVECSSCRLLKATVDVEGFEVVLVLPLPMSIACAAQR